MISVFVLTFNNINMGEIQSWKNKTRANSLLVSYQCAPEKIIIRPATSKTFSSCCSASRDLSHTLISYFPLLFENLAFNRCGNWFCRQEIVLLWFGLRYYIVSCRMFKQYRHPNCFSLRSFRLTNPRLSQSQLPNEEKWAFPHRRHVFCHHP